MNDFDLVHVYAAHSALVVDVSIWVMVALAALLAAILWTRSFGWFGKYEVVTLSIELGHVGKVELKPNNDDVQIAHRIWTELVTRKAAQEIDLDNDVIVEIYNSWYALFGRVRQLISDIPGHRLRKDKSTQELVRIATQTLNEGLRPHLTKWHARFRHWYNSCPDHVKAKCPQDCEREFPQYDELRADLIVVNRQLIQYAAQLELVVHGMKQGLTRYSEGETTNGTNESR